LLRQPVGRYCCLGLTDIAGAEQHLSAEIRCVDGIEVSKSTRDNWPTPAEVR
jgi:hypothetical protein